MKRVVTCLVAGLAAFAASAAQAQLKLGVAGPLTGPSAAFGQQFRQGVEQAADDVNQAGGINGATVAVVLGDDASDPRQGVSVANRFAGDKVAFVIGHYNSGVSIPASEVYAENQVLMITPSSTNPRLTERGLWNVFRTCGRDDQQGAVAAAHILKYFAVKRVAIVYDKTVAGRGLADVVQKGLREGGAAEALFEGINPGEKDYTALVSKLKAARIDLVYWSGLHTEGGLILRQMRDQGVAALLMGADGIASDEFAAIAGPVAEGTLMTFAPDPRKGAAAKPVTERLAAKKIAVEPFTLYSYAAVQVIQQAAARAKSLDPKRISSEIKEGASFDTVIGPLSYDAKGDLIRPDYVMYVWQKTPVGKFTYAELN